MNNLEKHLGGRRKSRKPDLTMKSGKFFLAKQKGLKDVDAALEAGIRPSNVTNIEKTENYRLCEKTYASALLTKTSLDRIAELNVRNMEQAKDVGGSNTAIKMAIDKIEPDDKPKQAQQINIVIDGD